MANFRLLAHPWWVNLLLLVPFVAYFLFRREKPQLTSRELLISAMFALSFGFVEGAVAIYLGVAIGLLSGHAVPLSDVAAAASQFIRDRIIDVSAIAGEPSIVDAVTAANRTYPGISEEAIAARIQKIEWQWDTPNADLLVKDMMSSRAPRWFTLAQRIYIACSQCGSVTCEPALK
jgi:hypothetical protein